LATLHEQSQPEPLLVDLSTLCANFPIAPKPELFRDNVVSTLKTLLHDEVYAVAIEGKEGIGKTTVLSQFVRKSDDSALSVFVSPANRLSYDPDLLRLDIAMQVYWMLFHEVLDRSHYAPPLLKSYYADLQRQIKQRKRIVYFVIDGVESLDLNERHTLLQQLADILPLGIPQFRFLFSGDESLYKPLLGSQLVLKSYPLTEFGIEETRLLFSKHRLSVELASDIRSICRGIPARLAGVLRAMDRGATAEEFVRDAPSKWPEFFDIDWKQVAAEDEDLKRILALLAFDRKPHTVSDISAILDIKDSEVSARINSVNFLVTDSHTGEIQFANDGLRRFVSEQLKDRKSNIQKRIIKRLLSAPEGVDSAVDLPLYLEDAAQYQDLLDILTPDHILQILERSQTLSKVDDTVRRGFRSAEKLSREPDMLRFGIQKSIVAALAVANVWESEVAALAALKRDNEALALANNAVLREDRLQMLAALVYGVWERGDAPPVEVLEQIRLLIDNLDYWSLGRRVDDIASKLVCVSPDLATSLLKKSKYANDDNDLDAAFAHFAITAIRDLKDERRRLETLESVTRSRQDPNIKGLLEGVRVLAGRLSAEEVCLRSDEIQLVEAKLSVLRYWCVQNTKTSQADLVARKALTTALATTSVRVDATLLADLSGAINGAPAPERRRTLISDLDAVRATACRLGPSVDYVRLQLTIAISEKDIDSNAAEARLVETADYVRSIADLPSKGECYARFLVALKVFNPHLSVVDNLRHHCTAELETVVLTLGALTADHDLAMGRIFSALAPGDLERALDYINTLNTEGRRDAALLGIVRALVHQPIDQLNPGNLCRTLDKIVGLEQRDEALEAIFQHCKDEPDLTLAQVEALLPLMAKLPDMYESILGCRSLVAALTILARTTPPRAASMADHLWHALNDRWNAIDVGWVRIDAGFGIATDVAAFNIDKANELVTQSEALKAEWRIATDRPASTYIACIRLACRAFCGLLPKRLDTNTDIDAIAALIDILPSNGERAALWAELCMRAMLLNRPDIGQRIADTYLVPVLSHVSKKDTAYRTRVFAQVAPALYRTQPATCIDQITQLDPDGRDLAIREIINFLISSELPSDPFEDDLSSVKTNYETLLQIASLTERLDTDWMIYLAAKDVATLMTSATNRFVMNTPQREDISSRFATIANDKLPIARQITHPGYRIVTIAQALKMRQAKPAEWTQTITEARQLENVADRVYVLQIVALALPKNMRSETEALLEEAKRLVPSIPWEFDQIDRYIGLAEDLKKVDSSLCREVLLTASKVFSTHVADIREQRRRLIDVAYGVDKELAEKLIEGFDDDEARRRAKSRVKFLELREKITEDATSKDRDALLQKVRGSEISKLGWDLLAALNAGRIQHYHPCELRKYLDQAAHQPLSWAYSVFSWYLENAVIRYSKTDQAATFLRPMFNACVVGAELAGRIAGKDLVRLRALKVRSNTLSGAQTVLITPSSREEAERVLTAWFEQHLGESVMIHDPYFSPKDLHWLQLIRTSKPHCRICIVASRIHQPTLKTGEQLDEMYSRAWKESYDQTPPRAEIAILGGERSGESPIHDRWLISGDAGVRLGSSFNSLGLTKDSEISEMSQQTAEQALLQIRAYLDREKIEHKDEKLRLSRFWLT
jgi:DNA-binding transcriptional regulator GbsR (MarR family)